jgi:hypothetical protein
MPWQIISYACCSPVDGSYVGLLIKILLFYGRTELYSIFGVYSVYIDSCNFSTEFYSLKQHVSALPGI